MFKFIFYIETFSDQDLRLFLFKKKKTDSKYFSLYKSFRFLILLPKENCLKILITFVYRKSTDDFF